MLRHALRGLGYTAAATGIGVRTGTMLERRVAGANAVTRRALMARRATMALLFHTARSHGR